MTRINIFPLLFIIISITFGNNVYGQTDSSELLLEKEIQIDVEDSLVIQESHSIIETSIIIRHKDSVLTLGDDYYLFSLNSIILFPQAFQKYSEKSLTIHYNYLAADLAMKTVHLDSSLMQQKKDKAIYIGYDLTPYQQSNPNALFRKGLDYDGSFGRGLSIGNSQNMVLNSDFNLQLSGEIGDGIAIKAAISDANIPIQAEGNTQQLQDFDRVFISLEKNQNKLIAGDFQIKNPASHFIRYDKKLEGIGIQNQLQFKKYKSLKSEANFAISRGKFARNEIAAIEGNQGPYKLQGNGGERFLIVLSGTEKVYLDGILLTRGIDQDYTISYDRAELIFTPKRLITREARIIVEFEYVDQKYTRSLYTFHSSFAHKNYGLDFQLYSEQDGRTASGNNVLDSLDQAILFQSGDADSLSQRSGIYYDPDGYNPEQIQYKLLHDSILIYSNDPDSAFYTAVFSDVGTGQGSYIIDTDQSANGRVYKFVGFGNGSYSPIIQLIAPVQKQMYALRGHYKFLKKGVISSEISLSNQDLNRFSPVQDNDNTGLAFLTKVQQEFLLSKKYNIKPLVTAQVEYSQSAFKALNPYRKSEFKRDWNLSSINSLTNEWSYRGSIMVPFNKVGFIRHDWKAIQRENDYAGNKHVSHVKFEKSGFNMDATLDILQSTSKLEKSNFIRPSFDASQSFKMLADWSIGMHAALESNQRTDINTDTLNSNSLENQYLKFYIQNPTDKKLHTKFSINQRKDAFPVNNLLKEQIVADELQWQGKYSGNKIFGFNWDLHYRDFRVDQNSNLGFQSKSTILGKLSYQLKLMNGGLLTQSTLQVNNGQEPKFELDYVEVETGRGTYIWIDENEDEIQQKEEFLIAPFQDQANFVRVSLFNNEFIQVQNNTLNFSLRTEGSKIIQKKEVQYIPKFLKKLSSNSNFKFTQRNKDEGKTSFHNPLEFNLNDSSLVAYTAGAANTIFFNKGNKAYDIQIGNNFQAQKLLQTIGFVRRENQSYFLRTRWNIDQVFDFINEFKTGAQSLSSESFTQNDYSFTYFQIKPSIQYRYKSNLRLGLNYNYSNKNEISEVKARSHVFSWQMNYRQKSRSNFMAEFSFSKIDFNGKENSSLELIMLEGLKNGNNFVWNFSYTKRMANNIDLNLQYNGRKPGTSKVVHVGNVQIKASF